MCQYQLLPLFNKIVFCLLISVSVPGFSQKKNSLSDEAEQTYNKIIADLGNDQVLSNGIFYENTSRNDLGYPYFKEDEFKKGYIVLRNKRYDNLLIKYNIFTQEVLVVNPKHKPQFAFLPPVDFISEFGFDNYTFDQFLTPDSTISYQQVIYDNQVGCYYQWSKNRVDSHHNVNYSAFKYTEDKAKRFLKLNEELFSYHNNGSFVKLFPEELAIDIKDYLKSNKIKVNKASDETVRDLLAYCEQLITPMNSTDEHLSAQ